MDKDSGSGGDPIDLDADRVAFTGLEASIAAAFRAGLEPDEAQTRRVIAGLPGIQQKARRGHRRRQFLAGSAVAVAAAGAVFLVVILPGTPSASVVPPAGQATPTAEAPVRVSQDSLLPASAVTAFDDHRLQPDPAPEDISGRELIAGVCVDGALPVDSPVRAWESGWRAVLGPTEDRMVSLGLIQKVWQWDDAGPARTVLDTLTAQVDGCAAGPGLEGRGVTTRVDATKVLAAADRVLVTSAAADPLGTQAIQVVMQAGDVVVQLDAVIPTAAKTQAGSAKEALMTLAPTALAALNRVQVGGEGTAR